MAAESMVCGGDRGQKVPKRANMRYRDDGAGPRGKWGTLPENLGRSAPGAPVAAQSELNVS
jgi:hypothetical protein